MVKILRREVEGKSLDDDDERMEAAAGIYCVKMLSINKLREEL